MDLILKYFPSLTATQVEQFRQMDALYHDWNAKINVISRKDIDNLYEHHVLHSLGIAELIRFKPGTEIMDLGTGGGFPGIPLAVMFPECRFHLIDSIGKKIKVCHCRAEEEKATFDFVVSRAVMPLTELVRLVRKNISRTARNGLPNGLICLKGGEMDREIMPLKHHTMVTPLKDFFKEEYFSTKKIVYVSI